MASIMKWKIAPYPIPCPLFHDSRGPCRRELKNRFPSLSSRRYSSPAKDQSAYYINETAEKVPK